MSPVRILLAAIVGGLITFIWGAVAHTALPLGEVGLSTIAEADERDLNDALKRAFAREGLYVVPGKGLREAANMSEAEFTSWEEGAREQPTAMIIFQPQMGQMMPPSTLVNEGISDVFAALLAAIVLATTATGYVGRVMVCTLIGVIGWLSISASYWIWYRFPLDYTIAEGVMQTVGWLLTGLVMAAIVKGRRSAPAVTSPS
jgi:hypothetical protein